MNVHTSLINQFSQNLVYQPFSIILFLIVGNIIYYLPLIFIHDEQTILVLENFSYYLDIIQMKEMNSFFQLAVYFFITIYPIVLILLYVFSFFYYKIQRMNNQFITQILCFLLKIQEEILFYPIIQIHIIVISRSFFSQNSTTNIVIFNTKYVSILFSGVSFIMLFITIFIQYIIIEIFGQARNQDREINSSFLKELKKYKITIQFIQSLIIELYVINNKFYNIVVYLSLLNQLIQYFIYTIQPFTYKFYEIYLINQILINLLLSISFQHFLEQIKSWSQYGVGDQKYDFDFLWIFILLTFFSFTIHKKLIVKWLYQQPKNFRQLQLKIESFQYVIVNKSKQYNQIQIIGIIKLHLSKRCTVKTLSRCFCDMKVIHDAKKQKDIRKLLTSITKHLKIFSKFIIKLWYEEYLQENQNEDYARIQFAKFNYYELQQIIQAFKQILNLQFKRNLNLLQKIEVNSLKQNIQNFINNISINCYKQQLDFENVIVIEEQIKQIETLISQILDKQIKIFKSILKESTITENEIIKGNTQMQAQITQILQKWKKITQRPISNQQGKITFQSFISKRKGFMFLDHWFQINILKVRKREPDTNLFEDDYIQEQSGSDDEDIYNHLKPFNVLSGIIHCDLQGQVKKTSQYCTNLFGNQRIDQINNFIPKCMRRNHDFSMNTYEQKEKRQTLFKKTKIFYLNEKQNLILANKYVKLFLLHNSKIEYICMIRPIIKMTPSNFILLDEDWEIDSVTANLETLFEKKTCLLLSCPKLIQFSQYNQFLKEDDLDIFNFSLNQQNNSCKQTPADSTQTRQFFRRGDQSFRYLLDQAQMDDQYTQNIIKKIKFHKIVNEENIVLFARFPFQAKIMQDEYFQIKQRIFDGNTKILKKLRESRRANLLIRNSQGQLRLNKFELFKRIYYYQLLQKQQIYQGLKKLFRKFCQEMSDLQKIIKVEGKIHFNTKTQINKNIVIKVNRFEIIEQEKQQKKQTTSTSSDRKRTVLTTSSNFIIRRNSDIFFANFFSTYTNNLQTLGSDNDSVRENITKTLITENELNYDFQNLTHNQLDTRKTLQFRKQNIFIKDDQNKMTKNLPGIQLIKFTNKILLCFLITQYFAQIAYGSQLYLKQKLQNYFIKVQTLTNFTSIISQTYNTIIDINIQNSNSLYQTFELQHEQIIEDSNIILQLLQQDPTIMNILFSDINDNSNIESSFFDKIQLFKVNLHILFLTIFEKNQNLTYLTDYFRKDIVPIFCDCIQIALQNQNQQEVNDLNSINNFFQAFMMFIITLMSGMIFINLFYIIKAVDIFRMSVVSFKNFTKIQLKEIFTFFLFLKQQLKSLNTTSQHINSYQLESIMNRVEEDDIKTKPQLFLIESKFWRKLKFKFILLYFLVLSALAIMATEFYLNLNSEISNTIDCMNEYSSMSNLLLYWALPIIKDQFLFTQNIQNITQSSSYNKIIQQFENSQFNKDFYSSSFNQLFQFYYGNICQNSQLFLNKGVTIVDQDKCNQLLNGALTKGLIQYYELLAQGATNLIDQNDLRFEKLSIEKLLVFSQLQPLVFKIQQLALVDIEEYLILNFDQKVLQEQILLITFLLISFIIYFLLIELYFHRQLENYYRQFRQLFHHFYPNELMVYNKLVRAQFIRYGILKK